MEVSAKAKYLRVSPMKLRRIANVIRDKKVEDALSQLEFLNVANKKYFIKLLNSIKANVKIKNPDIKDDSLFIKELYINKGPMLKRVQPKARGMSSLIKKRTSHIEIVVSDGKVETNMEAK